MAALRRARDAAYGEGEHIGQESFMRAGEILALARAADVTPGSLVLDLCCGTGGPALYLARKTGCRVVGVDLSAQGIRLAASTARAAGLTRRVHFLVADGLRLPLAAAFDVVLLLETFLAFEDKAALLHEVAGVLCPGGRFAFTLEEGRPLSREERARMPGGDGIWLVPEDEFLPLLRSSCFRVRQLEDCTAAHADMAGRLAMMYARHQRAIAASVGASLCDETIAADVRWAELLHTRRVRKLAIVTERAA